MRRAILAWLMFVSPLCGLLATAGCGPEIKSVQQSERIEQTEPQMTSPGQEVVE